MTVRRSFLNLAALIVAVGCALAPRSSEGQVATVSIKSAKELLIQQRMLANQFDPATAQAILQAVDGLENGGQFKSIDFGKPVAVTLDLQPPVRAGQPDLPQITGFVPVTSQADFLDLLKAFGAEVVDQPNLEGYSHRITLRGDKVPPLFVLASPPAGYVVVTTLPTNPAQLRAVNPAALRPARAGLLFASLRSDRLPEGLRELVLAKTKENNDRSRNRKDGESDAEFKGRLFGISLVENGFTSFAREGRELSLDLGIDPRSERLRFQANLDAKPGTATAAALGSFAARKSRFRGISQGAAVSMAGVLPIPESLHALILDQMKTLRDQTRKEEDADSRRLMNLVLDALEPSVTGDEIDAYMVLDAPVAGGDPVKGGPNVVLFGAAVKESRKIDATFREAAAAAAKSKTPAEVKLDHDRSQDGTRIHRVKLESDKAESKQFGEPYGFLAFPEGAAFMAVGGNGLPVIKQALGSLGKAGVAAHDPEAQVVIDVLATRFAQLYHDGDPSPEVYRQASTTAFSGKNAGKDQIHIGLTGETAGIRLNLDADLPVIRFLAAVGSGNTKEGAGPAR